MGMDVPDDIVDRIRRVIGSAPGVALHEPDLGETEKAFVLDCLASGWVSSVGKYVDQLERELASYTGAKHAVAVVNGTAALHTCLILAGVRPGDEVLCPALTFIATANAIRYCGAEPHFADVALDTLGMCPSRLEAYLTDLVRVEHHTPVNRFTGRRLAAVVPMHTFGTPVDLDPLQEVCERFSIPMIEDAAESLGSLYKGRHTGTWGLASAVSFNGNKIITAGGGGAILTNDSDLAARAKHLTTTAKRPHRWAFEHDETGFNYRMPNLNAALAVAQLSRLDLLREQKKRLAQRYAEAFSDCPSARFYKPPAVADSNCWLNAILVDGGQAMRDQVLERACDSGIATRPIWQLACDAAMYRECPSMDLTNSRMLVDSIVSIPSSAHLAGPRQLQSAA